MAYDLYPLPSLLNLANLLIQHIHDIWISCMIVLQIHWRKLYILNFTMRIGVTSHFQPLFHLWLINTIILRYQLHPSLIFHQWLNSIKKPLFEKVDINFLNPLSPLPCINYLPGQVVSFSSSTLSKETIMRPRYSRWIRYVQEVIMLLSFSDIQLTMVPFGGLIGTSIIWTSQIFLYMMLVHFLAQDGNQI